MIIIICVIIAVLLAAISQVFAKKYHDTKNINYLILSGIIACISLIVLLYAYQYGDLYSINNLYTSISIVLMYVVGYMLFTEKITTLEIIATIIIIIGIFVTYG